MTVFRSSPERQLIEEQLGCREMLGHRFYSLSEGLPEDRLFSDRLGKKDALTNNAEVFTYVASSAKEWIRGEVLSADLIQIRKMTHPNVSVLRHSVSGGAIAHLGREMATVTLLGNNDWHQSNTIFVANRMANMPGRPPVSKRFGQIPVNGIIVAA